jgi:hypothetical protein
MRIRGIDYERLLPLGPYENERITLHADVDETDNVIETFKDLKATVFQLHEEGKLLEESKKVAEAEEKKETQKSEKTETNKEGAKEVPEYNPENIPWVRAEGEKGIYERYPAYQQKPSMLVDYVNLLEDLKENKGRLQRAGLFYWLFRDRVTIGRKPAKK